MPRSTRARTAPSKTSVTPPKDELPDAKGLEEPNFDEVALGTPRYTGRRVRSAESLERAENRLKLAWLLRAHLEPALPGGRAFHARAWTALRHAQGRPGKMTSHPAFHARRTTLDSLCDTLSILRGIVEDLTRPGEPEREQLRFDLPLQPSQRLLDAAPEILDAARALQPRIPALTKKALERAQKALSEAQKATAAARRVEEQRLRERATSADDRALATDVLLECLDQLRAAARATLLPERPRSAAFFLEALEPAAPSGAPPAPAEPPAEPPVPSEAPR